VREDVQKLRDDPLIPREIKIYGFVYDVKVP
jgi:carbonic anhydrase